MIDDQRKELERINLDIETASSSGRPERRVRGARDDLTLELFAFLWAAFTFFHQSKWTWWTRTPIESLQTAAAIFVIFRPSSLSAFLALVCLQLADLLYTLPNISNHSIFALFVNLTVVLAALVHVFKRPDVRLEKAALLRLFAPAARVEVLILYCYVFLHKLNVDFLSTTVSCAVDHTLHLSGLVARLFGYGFFPNSELARILVIGSTLTIEGVIPVLLAFRKTRIAGVGLGIAFHYLLGLNIYHDFSGMIFALYLLFLPSNFAERAVDWWKGIRSRLREVMPPLLGSGAMPSGLWGTFIIICILLAAGNTWRMLHPIFLAIWVVYGLFLAISFLSIAYSERSRFYYAGRELRMEPALLVVPLLVLLNGFVPYLGLKTGNSFAMFSNLRTEGGKSNHLLIPASLQIFDFQKDLVTIQSSTIEQLQQIAKRGTAVPFFVLRDRVSFEAGRAKTNLQVAFTRNAVQRTVTNAELDPELSLPYPWPLRKFLIFREVDLIQRQICRH
jgi:hypothetical protein